MAYDYGLALVNYFGPIMVNDCWPMSASVYGPIPASDYGPKLANDYGPVFKGQSWTIAHLNGGPIMAAIIGRENFTVAASNGP